MTRECKTCAHFKPSDDGFVCELDFEMPTEPGKTCSAWEIWHGE